MYTKMLANIIHLSFINVGSWYHISYQSTVYENISFNTFFYFSEKKFNNSKSNLSRINNFTPQLILHLENTRCLYFLFFFGELNVYYLNFCLIQENAKYEKKPTQSWDQL